MILIGQLTRACMKGWRPPGSNRQARLAMLILPLFLLTSLLEACTIHFFRIKNEGGQLYIANGIPEAADCSSISVLAALGEAGHVLKKNYRAFKTPNRPAVVWIIDKGQPTNEDTESGKWIEAKAGSAFVRSMTPNTTVNRFLMLKSHALSPAPLATFATRPMVGLVNVGNAACFMSTIVQMLYHVQEFRQLLDEHAVEMGLAQPPSIQQPYPLLKALYQMFVAMDAELPNRYQTPAPRLRPGQQPPTQPHVSLSPTVFTHRILVNSVPLLTILKVVNRYINILRNGFPVCSESAEVLMRMMPVLQAEFSRAVDRPTPYLPLSCFESLFKVTGNVVTIDEFTGANPYSVPLQATQAYVLFNGTFYFPPDDNEGGCHLNDFFQDILGPKDIGGGRVQETQLTRLPPYLFIQTMHHRSVLVNFPLENLNLTHYVVDNPLKDEKPYIYDLQAVGLFNGGHYYTTMKSGVDGLWYVVDDAKALKLDPLMRAQGPGLLWKREVSYLLYKRKL